MVAWKVAFNKFALKLFFKFVIAIWLSISTVHADEIDTGYEAFKNKDYEKALTHLLPLAEQGYAKIQYMVYKSYLFQFKSEDAIPWLVRSADQGFEPAELEFKLANNIDNLSPEEDDIFWCKNAELPGFDACDGSTIFKDETDTFWDWFIYGVIGVFLLFFYGSESFSNKVISVVYFFSNDERFNRGARAYDNGDYRKAHEIFEILATQRSSKHPNGDPDAQNYLGVIYLHAEGYKQDLNKAEKWLVKGADVGNMQAQYNLANLYFYHKENRFDEALKLYKLAADQGLVEAIRSLGDIYYIGEVVEKDYVEAFSYYKSATLQFAYPDAQNKLAYMYTTGDGCKQNYAEAIRLFGAASDQGFGAATHNLGCLYATGEGVDINIKKALDLFILAGDQGHIASYQEAAVSYLEGDDINQDFDQVEKLLRRAMAAGDVDAQGMLGLLMLTGDHGFPEDAKEGHRLAKEAAENGSEVTAETLLEIEEELGPEAYREALKLQKMKASKYETVRNVEALSENNVIKFPKK